MNTQQQKQYRILLIGDSCTDVFIYGSCNRLSPEAPIPVFDLKNIKKYEGMVLNVKNNLLGLNCIVDVIHDENKTLKERYIDIKSKQHILRVDKEKKKNKILNIDTLNNFEYDAMIISDYNKGFLPVEIIENLLKKIRKNNEKIPIFVDSKKKDLTCYANCIIKINKEEYENLINVADNSELIVTLGFDGAIWNKKKYPTIKTEVYDVSGAGDSFLAGLVVGYLSNNKNLDKAIEFANICGSISVQNSGTHSVTLKEINNYYAKKLRNR